MPHECRITCNPDVQRIPLPVSDHTWGRYGTNPVRRPLPRPDRLRIIHADRMVFLDDPPAAFGRLPLQRIASQHLVSRPLPHKAPKLFLTFGSFTSLNSSRHSLQLIPFPGWPRISIFSQK